MPPGRRLVHTFGAHIALLLNTASGETVSTGEGPIEVVQVDAGALLNRLLRTLSGGDDDLGRELGRYPRYLVAVPLYRGGVSPLEAANVYFQRVLERPLSLARSNHFHHGHRLLLALCRRGIDPRWQGAELRRLQAGAQTGGGTRMPPADLADVAGRLGELVKSDQGPRVPAARLQHGAPCLLVDGLAVELPERLSLWQAICAGPRRLRMLTEAQLDGFRSQVVDAVVEANGPYGRRVALGLSPTEWDDVSTNLLKAISAFLSRVQALARATGATPDRDELWQQVWAQRPVPKFRTLAEFRGSPIGRALANGGPDDLEAPIYDPREIGDPDDTPDEPGPATAQPIDADMIAELERGLDIEVYDGFFLRALATGQPIAKIARARQTYERFGRHEIPPSYIAELSARVRGRGA